MIDPELKRQQVQKLVKWGVIGLGAAITAPLAYMMLEGLVMWGALIGTMLVISTFAPAIGDWLADKKVQAIIAIAEANPIETMENLYADKADELNKQDAAVREFDAQFRNVSGMVDNLSKTDPTEAASYVEMRDKMAEGLTELKAERSAANAALQEFHKQIDKAKRIWAVACAMNTALASANAANARSAVFADIKKQVAFDTVNTNLNRAFANLDSAIEKRKGFSLDSIAPVKETKALPEAVVEGQIIPSNTIKHAIART